MGIDGFSMGNLMTNTELTAAQVAGEAQHLAQKESKLEVKKMEQSAKDGAVKRKKDEENKKNSQNSNNNAKQNDEDYDDEKNSHIREKDIENGNIKDFSIKINESTNQVELLNNKDNRVMERIDADNLMSIVSKLNYASGIFVNKKI